MCRVYLCVRCLFSLFAFQNNCCCFCGCIRRRALMTLTGREETPRSRGRKESNSFSRTKRVCVHLYLNVFVFGHLFLEVFSCFVTRYILYAAYNKDSDTVWTDMCVCHRSVCVCVRACVHGCPFAQINWWMLQEDDQTGSTPGLLCDHTGIMGDMEL